MSNGSVCLQQPSSVYTRYRICGTSLETSKCLLWVLHRGGRTMLMCPTFIESLYQALDRARHLSHPPSNFHLHVLLQAALPDPEQVWSRRCTDVLPLSGTSARQRLCEEPARYDFYPGRRQAMLKSHCRGCLWQQAYSEEHGIWRRSSPLTCTDVPSRVPATASHLLSLQRHQQRLDHHAYMGR